VIGLPLTVITGFFGMNFDAIPGLHSPLGFWSAVIIMAGAVASLLWLFRRKNWI
jgi:magnesium transporter